MVIDIEQGRKTFESWRANRTNRKGRIPDELWNIAVELGRQHGHSKVADALRLSRSRLKDKILETSSIQKKPKVKSIETLKVAPVTLTQSPTGTSRPRIDHPTMIAEIVAPSGLSIRMFSGIDANSLKALSHMMEERI